MSCATSRRLVDAIVTRDWDGLESCLARDVWLRALLPRSIVEHHTATDVLDTIVGWFGGASAFEPRWVEHVDSVGGRVRIGWQVDMLPDWAPDTWHRFEQIGYCRVAGDRVRRLDLSCTGFVAVAP